MLFMPRSILSDFLFFLIFVSCFHYESEMLLPALIGVTVASSLHICLHVFIVHAELTRLFSQLRASKNGPCKSAWLKSIHHTCGRLIRTWPNMKFSRQWKINKQIEKWTWESTWSRRVSVPCSTLLCHKAPTPFLFVYTCFSLSLFFCPVSLLFFSFTHPVFSRMFPPC